MSGGEDVKQEIASKKSLIMILDLLEHLKIRYWVDGGWGIDVLIGKQTREHRDVDIDFDAEFEPQLLMRLEEIGYRITTDWRPSRVELYHPDHGYIDIHPFVITETGAIKQAKPEGGWYHFESGWFCEAVFEGRTIPCISVEGQRIFHSGYELRAVDLTDLGRLAEVFPEKQER